MKGDNSGDNTPKISIIARSSFKSEDFARYKRTTKEVREILTTQELLVRLNALVKEVTSLSIMLGRSLEKVNWLQGWGAFQFSGMTDSQVTVSMNNITAWVSGKLTEMDMAKGDFHSIEFEWVQVDPITFFLEAYLTPPAVVTGTVPGGGGSVVTPTQPRQPTPPF
jgi:hypothetical protein